MKKGIVHEAVQDAKQLKELAIDAAMARLVEGLTPQVKALVEKQLRGATTKEDIDRLRRAADGHGETEFEEAVDKGDEKMDKKELDLEALVGMFPGLSEIDLDAVTGGEGKQHGEPDGDECAPSDGEEKEMDLEAAGIPQLGESDDEEGEKMAEAKDDEDIDEEIEISEADLKKVYEEATKAQKLAEVQVSKGFKDMTSSGELDEVDPAAGIADVKKGESTWDQKAALPPDRKDWTVKEVKALVRQGMAENKALREANAKLVEALKATAAKLQETNLFNAKVLHVNKIFGSSKLTKEQKKTVVESIDKGATIAEVKKIALSLEGVLKATGVVAEGRKPSGKHQVGRTSGGANQELLRESADKGVGQQYSRWNQLAGIVGK